MTEDLQRDLRELPPPSLVVPEHFYERVMTTVRRRRRARWTGISAVALAVVTTLVAVGVSTAGGSGSARLVPVTPASSAPASSITPRPAPTRTPKPAPTASPLSIPQTVGATPRFVPLSVSFVSADLGWAFGPDQAPATGATPPPGVLAVTHDAGLNWATLPSPNLRYDASSGVKSVLFVDANRGYLYDNRLFETTDGGLHWRPIAAPGPVTQLAAADGKLYAIVYTCPASEPLCGNSALYAGGLDGGDFVRIDAVPESAQAQLSTFGSRVDVLTVPAGSVVSSDPMPAALSTSTDGEHWATFNTPCDTTFPDYGAVAAFGSDGFALVCGGQPGAGMQPKAVYVSTNGGAYWTLRSSALPAGDYVGLLAAADANTWVLAEQRNTLLITHDGGNTWKDPTVKGVTQGSDGWGQLEFTDATHAILVPSNPYSNDLLVTSDSGDTWTSIVFTP